MITVEADGVTCRFDDEGIDHEHPGRIHGALLKGVFYEQGMLTQIRSLGIRGTYVDVGASIGNHTIYFAMVCKADRVFAFEPLEHNFQRLRSNIALNDLGERVVPLKLALSDRQGEMRLTLDRYSEVVPIERLDTLVRERVGVIKIDVEGMEPEVLRGARRILLQDRPRLYAEAATKEEFDRLTSLLRPLGYEPTGQRFNATATYEFAPLAGGNVRRRAYRALLWVNRSPMGRLVRSLVPARIRRSVLAALRR